MREASPQGWGRRGTDAAASRPREAAPHPVILTGKHSWKAVSADRPGATPHQPPGLGDGPDAVLSPLKWDQRHQRHSGTVGTWGGGARKKARRIDLSLRKKKKKISWVHGEIPSAFSNSACAGQHQSGGQNGTPGAAKTRDRRPQGAGVRRSGRKAAGYARPLSSRGRGADQAGEATATGQATPGPLV